MEMQLYDDFSGNALNVEKWMIAQMIHEGEVIWTWKDDNLQTVVSDNRITLDIPKYSLSHDSVQMFDNPKVLYSSTKLWQLGDGPVSFKARLAADITGNKEDYKDGFASFNVLDFATGSVLDIVGNGHKVWAIREMLDIPGIPRPCEPFTEVIELCDSSPMQEHDIEVRYDPATRMATWYVDGRDLLTKGIEMDPQSFFLAFGMITLHPLTEQGSVSLRGQGGKARFGPFYVSGAAAEVSMI